MNDDVVEPLLCGMLLLEMPKNSVLELTALIVTLVEWNTDVEKLLLRGMLNEALGPLMSVVLELEVKLNLGEVAQVCAVQSVDL